APIPRSGLMIRFIGRFAIYSSPATAEWKDELARSPNINRVVVPEFPVSSTSAGSFQEASPPLLILTDVPSSSISTPIFRKQLMVLKQSSPSKNPSTVVVPSAIDPNMIARWEIDLSPGT